VYYNNLLILKLKLGIFRNLAARGYILP